ncbi:MAG: hypothetical protein GC136_02420 [Alphaproteobacteria bacterium]|nr:hypothetical protein [Alphaproteobacteria bacterium]
MIVAAASAIACTAATMYMIAANTHFNSASQICSRDPTVRAEAQAGKVFTFVAGVAAWSGVIASVATMADDPAAVAFITPILSSLR